jgi:hypothetical protein
LAERRTTLSVRQAFGFQMPPSVSASRFGRAGTLIRWSTLALAVQWSLRLAAGRSTGGAAAGTGWRGTPLPDRIELTISTIIIEELVEVALLLGLALYFRGRRWRLARWRWLPGRRGRWVLIALAVVLSVGFRTRGHFHQGVPSGLWAGVWAAGFVWIFLASQSVYPLVIAHAVFNLGISGTSWLPGGEWYYVAMASILAGLVVVSLLCDLVAAPSPPASTG